jgi:hypothetical protein
VYEESKGRPLFLVWEDTRHGRVDDPAAVASNGPFGALSEESARHRVQGPAN